MTGESCVLTRIDSTALLAEKAGVNLRTPYPCAEVKALCIPDAICDAIVENVKGSRGPEDPDTTVIVGTVTSRV
ncbi:hypothetical protein PoB_006003300 [Plakobranchus ocellatus]|uniref:Uncharacterized protein n=1 Tax=Plakobranchus ocellatus TaxID=259542 RepID=A0AAV4CNU3_9GAST|nr:hypothetical protein PoB_006003300 [Plakobranchus ocellatus]